MGEDAVDDSANNEDIDWKVHALKNSLTDKQQKLVDKIRSRELKISHMQKECERIEAKRKIETTLTQGQAVTLARNEQVIERLSEEIDDYEELLKDSIRESLLSKGEKVPDSKGCEKRKRGIGRDGTESDDEDDEFYDRTVKPKKKQGDEKNQPNLLTPEMLYLQRVELEEKASSLQKELESCSTTQQLLTMDESASDPLDSFMADVAEKIDSDKIATLEGRLMQIQKELLNTKKLLNIADPEGLLDPSKSKSTAQFDVKSSKIKTSQTVLHNTTPSPNSADAQNDSALMPPPPPMKIKDKTPDDSTESNLASQKHTPTIASPCSSSPHMQNLKESSKEKVDSPPYTKAQLEVMADLEVLSAASKPKKLDEQDVNPCNWKPPEGQSGDGRTHLNAKFGY